MKTLTLPLTALALVSLAACGGPGNVPPSEETAATRERAAESRALLDQVGMRSDDSYENSDTGESDGSMRLAGELAEGQWQDLGEPGLGYGRDGFQPVLAVRCDSADNSLVFTLPMPADPADSATGNDEAEAEATAADSAAAEMMRGSVISTAGVATGDFTRVGEESRSREIRITADEAVFDGLEDQSRFGVAMDGTDTVLVPLDSAVIAAFESCGDDG